ncbi:MAG: HEAT repeat domain-containing protein [Methanobacterium sp.]
MKIKLSGKCDRCGENKPLWKFEDPYNSLNDENICLDCKSQTSTSEDTDYISKLNEDTQESTVIRLEDSHPLSQYNDYDYSGEIHELLANDNIDEVIGLGDKSVDPLIIALKDDNNKIRKNSTIALGKLKNIKAIQPLINSLKDVDPDVRLCSADSLSNMGEIILDPLINALNDKNDNLRLNAVDIISKIEDDAIIEPLISLLDDKNIFIRIKSIQTLGVVGNSTVVNYLIPCLKDKNYIVRSSTAEALGDLGNEDVIKYLAKVLEDDSFVVRDFAKAAIQKIELKNLNLDKTSESDDLDLNTAESKDPLIKNVIITDTDPQNEAESFEPLEKSEIKEKKPVKPLAKTKICQKCGESKSLTDFYKNIRSKDGLSSYCKECMREYSKDHKKSSKSKKTLNAPKKDNPLKLLKKLR